MSATLPANQVAALEYLERGWFPIPYAPRSKGPKQDGWTEWRITPEDVPARWHSPHINLGVLTGDTSGGLIDIDLDHYLAVQLADEFLPETGAEFGRASKPRSHRLFVCRGLQTRQFKLCNGQQTLEMRGSIKKQLQTMFPPSVHPSGECVEWFTSDPQPTEIDGAKLTEAVMALDAEIKQRVPPRELALHAMQKLKMADGNDGSKRLFAVACRAVEYDLSDDEALATIREYERENPFPREWSNNDILKRIRDAEDETDRGKALKAPRRRSSPRRTPAIVTPAVPQPVPDNPTILRLPDVQRGEKMAIRVDPNEELVNAAAATALQNAPGVYERGGSLVHVVPAEDAEQDREQPVGSPRIVKLPAPLVREKISATAEFYQVTTKETGEAEWNRQHPPKWCVDAVYHRGHWGRVPVLHSVVEWPVLRPDGTIHDQAGFDAATGILYLPNCETPRIAEAPTRDDAIRAARRLLDVVRDFPFTAEHDRSAFLAFLLTPVARPAILGAAPLFSVSANTPGTGKTLLCNVVSHTVTGRPMPCYPNPRDDEEVRKRITGIVLLGQPLVMIDNCEELGGAAYDALLTSGVWSERALGSNDIVNLPVVTTFAATGNNIVLRGDTFRRVCPIRLQTPLECPEERSGFAQPDLLGHVRRHRGELLADILTIFRAYHAAGCPRQDIPSWGSFEDWSRLVRHPLVWMGFADPGLGRAEVRRNANDTGRALRGLLDGLLHLDPAGEGVTAARILAVIGDPLGELHHEGLAEAVSVLCPSRDNRLPSSRSLGMKLHNAVGRVVGDLYLRKRDNGHGTMLWSVAKIGSESATLGGLDKLDGGKDPGLTELEGLFPTPRGTETKNDDSQNAHTKLAGVENSPASSSSPGYEELVHRDDTCTATGYWEHLNGQLICTECYPCTDPAMMRGAQ